MTSSVFYSRLKSYYKKAGPRSQQLAVNVLLGGAAKGLAFVISLLQIPLILRLISPLEYGVWLTLYSIVGWFSFFDIGLGNGLRNKLTHALALNNLKDAKRYVSTTYVALSLIFGTIALLSIAGAPYVDWQKLLNAGIDFNHTLWLIAVVSLAGVVLNLITNLIHSILAAFQKTGISGFLLLITQFVVLLLTWLLSFYDGNKFLYLVVIISFTPLIINLLCSFWLFQQPVFSSIHPSVHSFDKAILKDILSLGYQFFVVQIAALVLFSTDSFLISHLFSPQEVIPYFLAFKYFSIVTIGFSIISPPIWSGFTHAFALKDIKWIKKMMTKLFYLWGFTIPVVALMVLFSDPLYRLWFGTGVTIPFALTLTFGVYTLIALWNSILSVFVNGTGELKPQFWVAIIGALLNIPLSIYLAKYTDMGLIGVPCATIICQLIGSVVLFYQYKQQVRI
jgi:O-antigen/teichoic acid export membrane protein